MLKTFDSLMDTLDMNSISNKPDQVCFASKETIMAFKVTLKSTVEMIDYLISDLGFSYVLTAKMNQDCLEVNL